MKEFVMNLVSDLENSVDFVGLDKNIMKLCVCKWLNKGFLQKIADFYLYLSPH